MRTIPILSPLLALCLAACSPAPPPAPVVAEPPPAVSVAIPTASAPSPPPPPPPACLPKAFKTAELFDAKIEGKAAVVCLKAEDNNEPNFCLHVDLASKAVSNYPAPLELPPPAAPAAERFTLTTTATEATVCPASGPATACKTLKVRKKGPVSPGHGDSSKEELIGAVSEDGQRAAFLIAERVPKVPADQTGAFQVSVEVHDIAKKKRLSRSPIPQGTDTAPGFFSDSSDNWSIRWLGDRLLLSAYRCCGPAGHRQVLDPTKGTFLYLGDPAVFEKINEQTWLVGTENRGEPPTVSLSFVHLDTGKRSALRLPSLPRDEPETNVLEALHLAGSSWVVAHANPPGLTWMDSEQEKITEELALPLCP